MNLLKIVLSILFFFLGASIGSFLNVVIYRLPRKESIVFPPSHCPKCGHKLAPKDLIPILSFLFLKGKCKYCKESISIRYLIVESLLGFFFLILFLLYDFSFFTFKSLIFLSLLTPIFFIDLEHMIIPDIISLPGFFGGILLSIFERKGLESLLGSLTFGGILLLIYLLALLIYKEEGMGQGDIKLGLLLGSFLNIKLSILSLFLSFIFGGLVSIFLLVLKNKNLKSTIPFGPFLIISGILSYFFGEKLLNIYLSLFF